MATKKRTEKIKSSRYVRSILDLGGYNDDEINLEPSMTDPSQDESIDQLVARMLRGEAVGRSQGLSFDSVDPKVSNADLMASQPVYERSGFDMADVPQVMAAGAAAAASLPPAQAPAPAPAEMPAAVEPVAPQVLPDK